jgi:hypothetical protein
MAGRPVLLAPDYEQIFVDRPLLQLFGCFSIDMKIPDPVLIPMPQHHKIGLSAYHYFQDLGRRSYSGLRACCPVLHAITTHEHKRGARFPVTALLRHFTDLLRKQQIGGIYSASLTNSLSFYKNVF